MTDAKPATMEMIVSPTASMPVLSKWFGDEIVEFWRQPPPSQQFWLLNGCIVWGSYVETFINWTIPTMLAPDNLAALAPCWFVVYTDAQGYAKLLDATKPFEQFGLMPVLRLIPDEVLKTIASEQMPSNRYWGLGTAHNLLLRMAHRYRTGFHMMAPDHLYAQSYFKHLRRLAERHEIIAQTGVSSNIGPVTAELATRKHPQGWLAVPDRDLGDLAWRNLHAQTRGYVMNDARIPDAMVPSHFMVWQGRDALHSYCCHQNAAWLSPRICREAPNFLPATIDTRLPHFGKDFYVPRLEDEMTFIEVSDDSKLSANFKITADGFAARCWAQTGFSETYMPYFMRPSMTPIHPQETFLDDETIRQQHQQVADYLWMVRPPKWMQALQQMPQAVT